MYKIHFTSVIGPMHGSEYSTFDTAVEAGKRAGFTFTVMHDGEVIAIWSYFGGLRRFYSNKENQ